LLIDQSTVRGTPLAGRVAIVTGAGRGIGRETARVLARVGASVVVAEIDDAGQDTVDLILSEGGTAIFVRTDVGDPASMARLADRTRSELGHADIVVNNAATFVIKPLLDQDSDDWERQLAVNLGGAYSAIRLFVPAMVERRHGVMVFLGSAEGMPYIGAYSATKAALRSLSASLGAELGADAGVSTYLFGPGMVDTPGGRMAFEVIAGMHHMTFDEFVAFSAPGGVLASAEASATGLVGTILNAPDFHGDETDHVAGLGRIGLDADGRPLGEDSSTAPPAPAGRADPATVTRNRAIEAIIETTISDIAGASMFARPMLRRGFRQATGMTPEEFLERARGSTAALEAGTFGGAAAEAYVADLQRLGELLESQTTMFRNWERDPAKLESGLAALAERHATVDNQRAELLDLVAVPA
jgi:NAD(P)-dependent dehydrogenase (short-subunit alcohol dehydrogenase family)